MIPGYQYRYAPTDTETDIPNIPHTEPIPILGSYRFFSYRYRVSVPGIGIGINIGIGRTLIDRHPYRVQDTQMSIFGHIGHFLITYGPKIIVKSFFLQYTLMTKPISFTVLNYKVKLFWHLICQSMKICSPMM